MTAMSQPPSPERIEEEASLWAARLDGGGMDEGDRAALAAWLEADPAHRGALGRYRELSGRLEVELAPVAEAVAQARVAAQRRHWRTAGIASAAAAAILISLVLWNGRARELATQTAERHVAALADGSRVELNARTSLEIDFRRAERHVRLVRGEALFTVAKDAARPFVVETAAGIVRVTGTVFDVRAASGSGGRVEVTVLDGTVRLRSANAAVGDEAVTPGNQAAMNGERIAVRRLAEGAAQDAVAWRQGQAVFDDTPLADAIERFAAYHARTITVDPAAADLRLGGRYSLDDLDGLLESVGRVLPVRVLRGADGAVRIAADATRRQ